MAFQYRRDPQKQTFDPPQAIGHEREDPLSAFVLTEIG
jgi:hypothetical protein